MIGRTDSERKRDESYWCQLAERQSLDSRGKERRFTLKENNIDAKTLIMPDTTYI